MKNVEMLPKLTLADGSQLPCDLFGVSSTGRLYIDVYGLSWREACEIFDQKEKTSEMTFPFDGGPETRHGFTVLLGHDLIEDGGVRLTMRRPYAEEE